MRLSPGSGTSFQHWLEFLWQVKKGEAREQGPKRTPLTVSLDLEQALEVSFIICEDTFDDSLTWEIKEWDQWLELWVRHQLVSCSGSGGFVKHILET